LGTDVLGQRIVPIFKDLDVKMDIVTLEDGKDTIPRNVRDQITKVSQQPIKAKFSTNPRPKLEVSQW
jgi:hypothetical protein